MTPAHVFDLHFTLRFTQDADDLLFIVSALFHAVLSSCCRRQNYILQPSRSQEAGQSLEALLTGGDTGPAIKPENAKKSLLIELIHFKEMPPKKATPFVTSLELELLRRWINATPAAAASAASKPLSVSQR